MSAINTIYWKKFKHERLYVESEDGTKHGYYCLVNNQPHPEDGVEAEFILTHANIWLAKQRQQPAPKTSPKEKSATNTTPAKPYTDLAANTAGASLRENAAHEYQQKPVRTTLARLLNVKNDEYAWRTGAIGEEKVGAQLAKLTKKHPTWRVIHTIPTNKLNGDIDHLVIGPGGLYVINTKRHPDAAIKVYGSTFRVNGHPQTYIKDIIRQRALAEKRISAALGTPVAATGMIVTVDAGSFKVEKQPPAGVKITYRMDIIKFFTSLGVIYQEDEIEKIYGIARKSTTWVN